MYKIWKEIFLIHFVSLSPGKREKVKSTKKVEGTFLLGKNINNPLKLKSIAYIGKQYPEVPNQLKNSKSVAYKLRNDLRKYERIRVPRARKRQPTMNFVWCFMRWSRCPIWTPAHQNDAEIALFTSMPFAFDFSKIFINIFFQKPKYKF